MNFEEKTFNAKIRFAFLGEIEGMNGLFVQLGFECGENKTFNTQKRLVKTPYEILTILRVLGVNSWEELSRKFVRIKVIDKNIISIGNIMEDEWIEWDK